jgi:hypothetical protein
MLFAQTRMEICLRQTEYLVQELVFFCEGPRSRRYRHTAALRLLVQPCGEDD